METLSLSTKINLALELATALDTKASTSKRPVDSIVQLGTSIGSTGLLLNELHKLLLKEFSYKIENGIEGAVKEEGIHAVTSAAAQFEIVCRANVANFTKASARNRESCKKAKDIDTSKLETAIVASGYPTRWLQSRVELSLKQLKLIKAKLSLVLQVFNLAILQVYPSITIKGRFEEERSVRSLINNMRKARNRQVSAALRKQKRKNPPSPPSPPSPSPPAPSSPKMEEIVKIEDDKLVRIIHDGFGPQGAAAIEQPAKPGEGNDLLHINAGNVIAPSPTLPPPPGCYPATANHPPPYMREPLPKDEVVMEISPIVIPSIEVMSKKPTIDSTQKMSTVSKKDDVQSSLDFVKTLVKQPDILSISAFQKQFGKVGSWVKELFGPSSLFFDDKPSADLDAYIVLGDKRKMKVPFGGRRLKFGMKKLMKVKKETTLDDFSALPEHLHHSICNAIQVAQIMDSRRRVLICFDVLKFGEKLEDQHILIFLSSDGPPVEPVHFKDAVGRKYDIPYFMTTIWEDMREVIRNMFMHIATLSPQVMEGRYDLIGPEGASILPNCWEATMKPGSIVSMSMWPEDPIRRPPIRDTHMCRAPPGPGPGPRPSQPSMFPVRPAPPGANAPLPFTRSPPPLPTSIRGPPAPQVPPAQRGPPVPYGLPAPHGPSHGIHLPRPPLRPIPGTAGRYRPWARKSRYNYGSDSSDLVSDSDMEDEECDLGVKIDLKKEKAEAILSVKELLMMWTNAPDVEGAVSTDSSSFSTSDSDSTSLADD